MISDTERREVAQRLRKAIGLTEFAEALGFNWTDDSDWGWKDVADLVADLIEPSCDRDALLALADEMERMPQCELCPAEIVDCSAHPDGCPDALLDHYARRIREALGVEQ